MNNYYLKYMNFFEVKYLILYDIVNNIILPLFSLRNKLMLELMIKILFDYLQEAWIVNVFELRSIGHRR